MASLNEIVFDILEIIKGNEISDDVDIDPRHIEYLIKNQRALQLRNEYNKPGRTIDHNIIQTLCAELEVADRSDCPEITVDCDILRTKKEIPNTIEFHNKTAITRVAPIDKLEIPYSFIPYQRAIFSGNGKFNKNVVFAFLHNNRIYLKSKSTISRFLTHITIRGVFEDPTDVIKFSHTHGGPCFSLDDEYPVNIWMIPFIKEQVLRQLGIADRVQEDKTNNASDDKN